ncbi:MAG: tetratricopeptide repeat protein [Actinomycetota bacterium]
MNERGDKRGGRPRAPGTPDRKPPTRHRPRHDRDVSHRESKYDPVHLSEEIAQELRTTARPGKGDILVKVFADAVAAYAAGDLDEAIRLGEQAKHIALRSIAAREFLGLAYYNAGRWNEAARELGAFRRISGSTAQNPVIADTYRAMQKPERALELIDEIDRAKVDDPVFYEGQIVAAGALADMDRVDDAIARVERLELRPDVAEEHHLRVWYVLGDLLARRGRFTQARKWFEAVAAADPDATDAPERVARLAR